MYHFSDSVNAIKPGGGVRALAKYKNLPGMISFTSGMPAAEFLPTEELKAAFAAMMDEQGRTALLYGDTAGWYPLREQICQRMKAKNQIDATTRGGVPHRRRRSGHIYLRQSAAQPG